MRSESLGVVALLAACAPKGAGTAHPSPNAAPVTAIVNATVIPMDTERLIRNAAVVIRGDRIVWVGPTRVHPFLTTRNASMHVARSSCRAWPTCTSTPKSGRCRCISATASPPFVK